MMHSPVDKMLVCAAGKDTRVRVNVMRGTWCGRNKASPLPSKPGRQTRLVIQLPVIQSLVLVSLLSLACQLKLPGVETPASVSGANRDEPVIAHSVCCNLPPQPHRLPIAPCSACTVTLEMALSQTRGPGDGNCEGRVNGRRNATQRVSVARVFPLTAPFLSPPPEFQCMFWPGLGPQDKKPGLRPLTSGLQSTYQTVARGEHGCNNRGAAGRDTMASHTCPMNSTNLQAVLLCIVESGRECAFRLAHSLMRIRRPGSSGHNSFLCSFLDDVSKQELLLSIYSL